MDEKDLFYAEFFFAEPQTVEDAIELTKIRREFIKVITHTDGFVENVYYLYNPYPDMVRLYVGEIIYNFIGNSKTQYSTTLGEPGIHIMDVAYYDEDQF